MINRAILHIGAPKTGTSILQSHLAQNRVALRDKGIFYPITISDDTSIYRTYESHHLLTYSWAGWAPFNRFDPVAFWERVDDTARDFDLHTILLSAENAFWLPRQIEVGDVPEEREYWAEKKKYVERIYEDLRRFDAKIVIYLRCQDRWIESWYNQQVKNGRQMPQDFMKFVDHHHYLLDYGVHLDVWAEVFGRENIVVRPYESQQLPEGLLEDFLQTTEIGTSKEFPLHKKGRHNAQLSRDTVEFMNVCNGLPLDQEDMYRLRILIRRITNQFDSQVKFLNQEFLSPQNRLSVLEKYAPINERVAHEFMDRSDGVLFKDDWPNASDSWQPYPGLNTPFLQEMLMQIIVELLNRKKKTSREPSDAMKAAPPTKEERNEADRRYWGEHIWDYE